MVLTKDLGIYYGGVDVMMYGSVGDVGGFSVYDGFGDIGILGEYGKYGILDEWEVFVFSHRGNNRGGGIYRFRAGGNLGVWCINDYASYDSLWGMGLGDLVLMDLGGRDSLRFRLHLARVVDLCLGYCVSDFDFGWVYGMLLGIDCSGYDVGYCDSRVRLMYGGSIVGGLGVGLMVVLGYLGYGYDCGGSFYFWGIGEGLSVRCCGRAVGCGLGCDLGGCVLGMGVCLNELF